MTANDILQSALALSGQERAHELGFDGEGFRVRGLELVNRIADDLCAAEPAEELGDELHIPATAKNAAAYGVAMLLALCEGDSARNEAFGNIYNGLRATVKSKMTAVRDTLPKGEVAL